MLSALRTSGFEDGTDRLSQEPLGQSGETFGVAVRHLVERAQRGDREAFAALAEASIADLYNLAQLMLSDGDLAQDAVQDALIAAWRDLRALRDVDRFRPWLRRILVNAVYRTAKRERQATREIVDVTLEAGIPDPSRAFENRDAIARVFVRLRPEHRAVLVVHHYLELTDAEAAEMLGIPPGTVKSRLHRAHAEMRSALEADSRAGDARVVTR
jgi:RNA polymerase sigma factor (sigma-70 family)